MVIAILEPIGAGIIVSLINKYIIGADLLSKCWSSNINKDANEVIDEDTSSIDENSNTITAINSDTSNNAGTHVHMFF